MGAPYSSVERWVKAARAWEDAPQGHQQAVKVSGLDMGLVKGGWIKVAASDGTPAHSVRWSVPQEQGDPDRILDAIRDGLADMPRAVHTDCKAGSYDILAVFPVADLHIGMLADLEETGHDWDGKKATRVFQDVFGRLVSVTPGAGTALLAQLGDLMHVDDQTNLTQSGHQLDADTRYFMILRRAVVAMKYAIDTLRGKYASVIYRGCRGNHDRTAHYAVTLALSQHYADVEGVTIIDHAGEFYVHEFGKNMIVLHHGDKANAARLVNFAAAEWPEIWGRTRNRLALSGHIHHETRKEIGGMTCESIGTIIPRDAYAYGHAYSANRALVSITLDAAEGEISRARRSI
jgi:predicted phosphodiesterase